MKCKHILVHRGSYDECEKCGAVRECSVLYGMPCGSKNPHAVALGKRTSKKKKLSSRENGKKGGRPRKTEYYYSNSLDRIREEVRIRDKRTCQDCGKKWKEGMRRFDVHHLDEDMQSKSKEPKQHLWDKEHMDRLITLCHKCHMNIKRLKI